MREENVLIIALDEEAKAARVLETLERLGRDGGVDLRGAASVRRSPEGRVSITDHIGDVDTAGTFAERHPRLATLLTILAGPLDTLLFGNSLVALTGALAEPSPDELALEHLARSIPPGRSAVIAEVVESDPGVVDRAVAPLGARVVRRPVAEVDAEIGAADEAVEVAGAEARRILRGTRAADS